MTQESAVAPRTTATYTVLQRSLMLGSLPLAILPLLLPLYAKQFGASALGIGGLFVVAQGMMVVCQPVIGWGVDRWEHRGFCLVGLCCAAGAMGGVPPFWGRFFSRVAMTPILSPVRMIPFLLAPENVF